MTPEQQQKQQTTGGSSSSSSSRKQWYFTSYAVKIGSPEQEWDGGSDESQLCRGQQWQYGMRVPPRRLA